MRSCAVGSSIGGLALASVLAIGACRSTTPAGDIPPVTSARANAAVPITSDGHDASKPSEPIEPIEQPRAAFREGGFHLDDGACARVLVAVASGSFTVDGEALAAGDVAVLMHPEASDVKGSGLAVEARSAIPSCVVKTRPAPSKTIVKANAAEKLTWSGGKMSAHLDVGSKVSPDLYLGRLEGTAPVAEHVHQGSWEILASIEAAGTFILDGKEQRLGPRQIVFVPPNTRHSWKPDPGSKLVAIQMYSPPGPEQRFVALAAADKDAGKP